MAEAQKVQGKPPSPDDSEKRVLREENHGLRRLRARDQRIIEAAENLVNEAKEHEGRWYVPTVRMRALISSLGSPL